MCTKFQLPRLFSFSSTLFSYWQLMTTNMKKNLTGIFICTLKLIWVPNFYSLDKGRGDFPPCSARTWLHTLCWPIGMQYNVNIYICAAFLLVNTKCAAMFWLSTPFNEKYALELIHINWTNAHETKQTHQI